VLDLETRSHERLLMPQRDLGPAYPTWLPDGRTLAATRYDSAGTNSLWLLSLDGTSVEDLAPTREMAITNSMGVSPDGRRLLVPLWDGPEIQLYEIDLATGRE
jgi:Tol biopolymer transport system component